MNTISSKFVSNDMFNAYVRNLNSRIETEEKLNDLRMDRVEAIINESNATISGGINLLNERLKATNDRIDATNSRIDSLETSINEHMQSLEVRLNERIDRTNDKLNDLDARLNERIDNLEKRTSERFAHMEQVFSEKLEHVVDTLSVAINDTNQRITDMKEDIKAEQSKSLTKWGIGVALFVGAVQVIVSVVLHFLG